MSYYPSSAHKRATTTTSLLQRTIMPSLAAPCASVFGLKFASRLNSFWEWDGLGRVQPFAGVLVMGIEHLPRSKQQRLAEPSLRVVENTDGAGSLLPGGAAPTLWDDEHSDHMHSLLEENALLRRMLIKLDLVLKKVVGAR
jgi:hypothetical protein